MAVVEQGKSSDSYPAKTDRTSNLRLSIAGPLAALIFFSCTEPASSQSVTRGPYLQMGSSGGLVVRWRTDLPTTSRAWYGSEPGGLTSTTDDPLSTTEHAVTLSGLAPETTYYYAVGSDGAALAGNDWSHFFVTAPEEGGCRPTRIWVLGDSGYVTAGARAVRDAYLSFTGGFHTDFWIMLGNNAASLGTDLQYQAAVFNRYPTMLRSSVLWPTPGFHEGTSADSATGSGPYYDAFTIPRSGEAGGVASGTEAYYSFDHGDLHVVSLDSYETNRSTNGAMMTWLEQDLSATQKPWVIAFWYDAPYSKGQRDSDVEKRMTEMRQNALPVLERHGVDLVLASRSHSYERSFLIDGHYGTSSTFAESMKLDGGDGRIDGTGAYHKPTAGRAPHEGTVYVVAGSSSQIDEGPLVHPAMYLSLNSLGSLVLEVNGLQLDARFLDSAGVVRDYFTIRKGPLVPSAPRNLAAVAVSSSRIELTWDEESPGETGVVIERSPDGSGAWTPVAEVPGGTGSYPDNELAPLTTYHYRVLVRNDVGTSPYSNLARATTTVFSTDPGSRGIWMSPEELAFLPIDTPAWQNLKANADLPPATPVVSNQEDPENVLVLARALVYARTGIESYRTQVITSCLQAIDTELGGDTLALGRKLIAYVISADLVGLPPDEDEAFRAWLRRTLTEELVGKTLVSTHEVRLNNWGTVAGASRAAVAIYLGDFAQLQRCAQVFRGWVGDRSSYAGFKYTDLSWQSDPANPVGINPLGAQIEGLNVDGLLPDDQRRSGPFTWPPPKANYVYSGLQGAVAQAEVLHRAGYDAWEWQDQALFRSFKWLNGEAQFPAVGDDTWQPPLVNFHYQSSFPAPVPSIPGKNMGWTDWTHGTPSSLRTGLHGRVQDSAGKPIAGALVRLLDECETSLSARSNASGFFRFVNPAPGTYLLACAAPGAMDRSERVVLLDGAPVRGKVIVLTLNAIPASPPR